MYTPSQFKIDDPSVIRQFIEENSFGVLLSSHQGQIYDTHTPFVQSKEGDCLLGHIARANPQWKFWNENPVVKVIFTGPHAYISPRFYVSEFAVPTWNYTAVSISGKISILEEEQAVLDFLDTLVEKNEGTKNSWTLDRTDERYIKLLTGIVAFSISIESVECCFKMNQNKSSEDREKVIDSLSVSGCPFDEKVAGVMSGNKSEITEVN